MAFEDGTNTTMLVSPAGLNGGNGGFGDGIGGWWLILLIIILFGGGNWNNGGNGGYATPYFVDGAVQAGFNQATLTSGLGDIQGAITGGFANAEVADNARQMANMQQLFGLSQQLSTCCCENRLATCQTQNTIQNEASATRFADANNTRDIIDSQTRGIQAIMDKLCALEIDAKNDKIADLERQLTMANLRASQTAQTSTILADNSAQTVALEQYLNPVPKPAYIVPNPNTGVYAYTEH